ncbi:MAG: lantibiotic dehydratase C-terminal domain-containing protein [Acidobacteriota bacterium]
MSSIEAGPHLAGNVYRWHLPEQTALLVNGLVPAIRDLRRTGSISHFWFDRFDARGPHLFLLLTVSPGRLGEVRRALGEAIRHHLSEHPASGEIGEDELALRHRQCLGKSLCVTDAEEGFAERDSVRWCAQPADGYPLRLLRATSRPDEAWRIFDRLADDVLRTLGEGTSAMAAAVAWLSRLEAVLGRAWSHPSVYWRHHAASIIRRMQTEDDMAARLAEVLGPANLDLLSRAWESESSSEGPTAAALERLLAIIPPGEHRPSETSPYTGAALLREVVHVTLKQLALPIHRQRPLILYGWKRALDVAAG